MTLRFESQDGTVIDTWDSVADFGGPLRQLTPDQRVLLERHSNSRTIDVLARIDPQRDAANGTWLKDNRGLYSPRGSSFAGLRLPIAVPEEYALTIVAERPIGWNGMLPALVVGLAAVPAQFVAIVDWEETTGLEPLDGKPAPDNESTAHCGSLFRDGHASVATYIVRRERVEILFDGRQVVSWTGDYRRFRDGGAWGTRTNSPLRLFLGTHCDWHFKAIQLTPLTDAKTASADAQQPRVNLLKTIDLQKHARGGWRFDGPVLVSPANVSHAGVRFPGVVPDEYRLRIVAERPRGFQGPPQLHVGLVTRLSQATLVLDADHKSGLEAIGGKMYHENATTFPGDLFIDGVESTIDCYVDKESIRVAFDGHTIINWHGDPRQLTPTWTEFGAPKRTFWIGTHCNWRIKKMELLPFKKE